MADHRLKEQQLHIVESGKGKWVVNEGILDNVGPKHDANCKNKW